MIALPISSTIITDVPASYRHLGNDQWPSVFRASCSADRCESLGGLLCHMVNILARYKHHKIALSIRHTTVTNVSAMTSGHRSLEHLVVPTDVNLSAVVLCHTVNISALYKHCTIALPISATMITDVPASYKRLGSDQWPSVFRASCSADRCASLGSLTLSHR